MVSKFSSTVSVVTPLPKAGQQLLLLTIKSKRFNICWPETKCFWGLAAQFWVGHNSLVVIGKQHDVGTWELPCHGSLSGFSSEQGEFVAGDSATTALQTVLCKWKVCHRCDVASFISSSGQHYLLRYLVPAEGGSAKLVSTKDFCLLAKNGGLWVKVHLINNPNMLVNCFSYKAKKS